jgi:hypothetical protein
MEASAGKVKENSPLQSSALLLYSEKGKPALPVHVVCLFQRIDPVIALSTKHNNRHPIATSPNL